MTSQTFVYGGKTYDVTLKGDTYTVNIDGKTRKVLLQSDGSFKKSWAGREPGSANGATSTTTSKTGNIAPDSGLWAKVRAKVAKALQIEPESVGIVVTNKTVTVNADEVGTTKSGRTIVSSLCTWSGDKDNWFAGLPGIMSVSASVQDEHTKAAIVGLGETLDNWHK